MKKLVKALATVLALALCLSLASAALAAEYVVAPGDSLWRIAQRTLGRGSQWSELYEANRDTVQDPSHIYVGQRIVIPDALDAAQSQPDAQTAPAAPTGKVRINFEGRITAVEGDRVTLDSGKVVVLTESTLFTIPQGAADRALLTEGAYIQGYTADGPEAAEFTAEQVHVTPL